MNKHYISGYFDGEGNVGINYHRPRYQRYMSRTVVQIGTTDTNILKKFNKLYGGNIYRLKTSSEKHKKVYLWKLENNKEIIQFLEDIIPFLILKKQQAKLGLEFAKHMLSRKKGIRLTEEELGYRDKVKAEMNFLNKRGR